MKVYGDNMAELTIAGSRYETESLRGVRVAHHQLKDEVQRGLIDPTYARTTINTADAFTKPLDRIKFYSFNHCSDVKQSKADKAHQVGYGTVSKRP